MKIPGNKSGIDPNAYVNGSKATGSKGGGRSSGEGTKVNGTDSVSITDRSQEIKSTKAKVDGTPDVRETLVVQLKTDIEKGSYKADVEKVAEKIIDSTLRGALNKK